MSGEENPGKVTRTIGSLLVTAGAGAGAAFVGPAGAAALALAPHLTDRMLVFLIRHREERANRRARAWFAELMSGGEQVDVDLLEAQLSAHADDPAVQDVVLEGARALEDALIDGVVPHLARLTRSYRLERRPADLFFRGMRRLLCDLGENEFRTLREFIRRSQLAEFDEDEAQIQFAYRPITPGTPTQLVYLRRNAPEQRKATSTIYGLVATGDLPGIVEIFGLMKRNGLAFEGTGSSYGAQPGPHVAVFECADLARMWPVVSK